MRAKLHYFAFISGFGWLLDFVLFNCFIHAGCRSGTANMMSASAAVTFVYVLSRKWLFRRRVDTLPRTLAKYVVWNVAAISLASFAVQAVAAMLGNLPIETIHAAAGGAVDAYVTSVSMSSITAKVLVTPLTMYANFIAMGYIVERRLAMI